MRVSKKLLDTLFYYHNVYPNLCVTQQPEYSLFF